MLVKGAFLAPLDISAKFVFVLNAVGYAFELENHRIFLDVIVSADQDFFVLPIIKRANNGRILFAEFHIFLKLLIFS